MGHFLIIKIVKIISSLKEKKRGEGKIMSKMCQAMKILKDFKIQYRSLSS